MLTFIFSLFLQSIGSEYFFGFPMFFSVCPNGYYQETVSTDICSTWFDINRCNDSTCDTVDSTGYQTRCNLNAQAVAAGLVSAGTICEPPFEAPYRLDQTENTLPAWSICSWCCNYCNETDTIGKYFLTF